MRHTPSPAPLALAAIVLAGTRLALGADDLPPSKNVPPELFATGFEWAEAPAFDQGGNLYVANYRGNGNIGRITPDGAASVWCVLDQLAPVEGRHSRASGLKVDRAGRLVAADAGAGRLLRIAPDGKKAEVLADRFEGSRFLAVHDVALDTKGNIYFTDAGSPTAENPSGCAYRFDIATASVSRLVTGLASPLGIGVSPDQQHLCVSESLRYRILLYDLLDRNAVRPRVLIDFPRENVGEFRGGLFPPAGLTFDAAGRLYVAMGNGGVINVVDLASGRLLRQYDAGGGGATNCHFSGPYLYVTVAAKEAVFRLRLGVSGFDYNRP